MGIYQNPEQVKEKIRSYWFFNVESIVHIILTTEGVPPVQTRRPALIFNRGSLLDAMHWIITYGETRKTKPLSGSCSNSCYSFVSQTR